jgi:hypothetical protein
VARKSIIVSDISGREIRDEKDAAKVAINYGDARRGRVELDVLASEVDDLAGKGRKVAKRGRKPRVRLSPHLPALRGQQGNPASQPCLPSHKRGRQSSP